MKKRVTAQVVLPAKAGIQVVNNFLKKDQSLDSRFRGKDSLDGHRQLRKRLISILALVFFIQGNSRAHTVESVLRQMEEAQRALTSVKFRYHQEVEFKNMSPSPGAVEGEAYFSKPNKLALYQKLPTLQQTISNGKKMWIYTPRYKQVWAGRWKDWAHTSLPKGMIPFTDYVRDLKENFNLVLSTESEGHPATLLLKATPKPGKVDYQLDLKLSTDLWIPTRTIYRSDSAEVSTVLSEIEINPTLNEKTFTFVPPVGTDVIPF